VFGSTTNAKGFKVIRGAGVIQGDGINVATIGSILAAVVGEGFSAENVAFGMGGGLLQRVNRCAGTGCCGCAAVGEEFVSADWDTQAHCAAA
jgi:nicotinic acid phosphoribosyltransferase